MSTKKTTSSPYTKALIASQFWQHTALSDMSQEQWEAICDGCGKCCLHKFIDAEDPSEEVVFTNIACHLLHTKKCECSKYSQRLKIVPHCVNLSKEKLEEVNYMPSSCAYRRLHEGRGLAGWHPLLNGGKKNKMHSVGMSVRDKAISEHEVNLQDFEDYIVSWPLTDID